MSEQDTDWNKVANDSIVHGNDRIATGPASQALVKIPGEQTLTVESHSLVSVTEKDEHLAVDVTAGGVVTKIKKGQKLSVKFKGQETELASKTDAKGDATVRLSAPTGKKLNLAVLSGEVAARPIGKRETDKVEIVQADSQLDLSTVHAKPAASPIHLLEPLASGQRWLASSSVEFRWDNPGKTPLKIEMATDPDFRTIVKNVNVRISKASIDLPKAATYFWRLRARRNDEILSVTSSFTLQALIAPRVAEMTVVERRQDRMESVSWTDELASENYEIEFSRASKFSVIESKQTSASTSVSLAPLPPGRHFWRVRSITQGRESLESNAGILIVKEAEEITPIVKSAPAEMKIKSDKDAVGENRVEPAVESQNGVVEVKRDVAQVASQETSAQPVPTALPAPSPPPSNILVTDTPLAVKATAIKLPVDEPAEVAAPASFDVHWPQFWVWLGGGIDYQYYQQTIPNINGNGNYQNIQSPVLSIRGGFQGDAFGLDVSYRDTPGQIDSSPTTKVINGTYHWRTIEADALYRLAPQWNLRFGFQHHIMPFMSLDPNARILDVRANTLTMASIGFDRYVQLSKKLRGEWMMRYQFPLVAGSSDGTAFSVRPRLAFDGSLGGVYSLTERSRLGAYWYGQYHNYGFNYGSGTSQSSGEQTLFYSSVEFRLGYEF